MCLAKNKKQNKKQRNLVGAGCFLLLHQCHHLGTASYQAYTQKNMHVKRKKIGIVHPEQSISVLEQPAHQCMTRLMVSHHFLLCRSQQPRLLCNTCSRNNDTGSNPHKRGQIYTNHITHHYTLNIPP